MAMVTVMRKREGGRLQPLPQRLGPGCPQARQSLDTSVRSETGPSLPTADIHTGLATAGHPGCTPPAPLRPPRPLGFTPGWILTQLLTVGTALEAKKTVKRRRKTKSHFLPPW